MTDFESINNGMNFTLTTTLGAIDLLGEITGGGGFEDILPHTISLNLFGLQCSCINLERLIYVKRAAGRPKDMEALSELESLLEEHNK